MAKATEMTFKDLQMDERYKRLERTLKMVLLKNAEGRTTDNGNTGTWTSISSINGDNLDTSCAAMSVQSSRIGSEVVSSSANLRNIMSRKSQTFEPRNNMATSSENQFPINKDNDSAMMPPPKFPGPTSGRSKRSGAENFRRTPLSSVSMNLDRKADGFTQSTPNIGVPFVSRSTGSSNGNFVAGSREKNDYHRANPYECTRGDSQPAKPQERKFSRWRVLLNDKAQLIIKGTLECGKIARSKPVIRRLTVTSVQSIFKHTYHLCGNLVDERNELPDYVSGAFYNGFPDDWENVYQVWRNFVSNGSRLSFRWPTPITDSDDDIKSEITEISYSTRFEKFNKSRSPRKRTRYTRNLSPNSPPIVNKENHLDANAQCACSHINVPPSSGASKENSIESLENLSKNCGKSARNDESVVAKVTIEKNKSFNDTSMTSSFDGKPRVNGNTLKDLIQEDKLNIIIDNLTNKNCSLEYVRKIVEMFDCMKYVVSYQSTETNDTERINHSKDIEDASPTIKTKNHSMEDETNVRAASTLQQRSVLNRSEKRLAGTVVDEQKLQRDRYSDVRKKLTKDDYDSTESDNDYYETRRRALNESRSREKIRKSHRFKDHRLSSSYAKTKQQYRESPSCLDYEKFNESRITSGRGKTRDSSLSEEEFQTEETTSKPKNSLDTVFPSPRSLAVKGKDFRRTDSRDSSVSLTEDENEECRGKVTRARDTRRAEYDSSVSITEDERTDARIDRRNLETLNYRSETNLRPVDPDVADGTDDLQDVRASTLKYHNESNYCLVDSADIGEKATGQRNSRKSSTNIGATTTMTSDNRGIASDPTTSSQENKDRTNDFSSAHQEDSAQMFTDVKRQKISETIRTVAKRETNRSLSDDRSNDIELQRNPETRPLTTAISKIQQVKKKPLMISSEIVNVDIREYTRPSAKNGNDNDINADNANRLCTTDRTEFNRSSNDTKNTPIAQKISTNLLSERAKLAELASVKSTKKDASFGVKDQDDETRMREANLENVKSTGIAEKTCTGKFGSEENPKQLVGWVPAVICEDDDESKCRLIFEGKLLNEAGHVVNRKFTTDFVKRRIGAKLIETIGHDFYRLVGDLKDTKRVVPKDLVKLCHAGCPSKINSFCEKWKILSTENNETPTKTVIRSHNTSVDCLGVPTSSRGRRILPPLNYWTGERVTTKDNKAFYSPGNCKESSITSSLEKTNEEITDKRSSPKSHKSRVASNETREKRTNESNANDAKKKKMEKISPPGASKSYAKKPSHESQRGKRRLSRKMHDSSSESDESKTKPLLRKRKMRKNDTALNTATTSTRRLRNSNKNTTSSQSLEASTSSRPSSFEKPAETEMKSKLRKRRKVDQDEAQTFLAGTSKQLTMRGSSEVTCAFYKNVPSHDADLSEDQLSTM